MRIRSIVQATSVANAIKEGVGYRERPNDTLSPAPTAPTTHANDHRPFVRSNATSDKSAAFRRSTRFVKQHLSPLCETRSAIPEPASAKPTVRQALAPPVGLASEARSTTRPITFHLSPPLPPIRSEKQPARVSTKRTPANPSRYKTQSRHRKQAH
jgi:hypothetical protein